MKQRLLMVGRMRYSLPLSPSLEQKFDALSKELDVRVLASAAGGRGQDARFRLVRQVRPRALDGPSFYALLLFRVAREIREFRPDAVLAQGAQEAALVNLGRKLARVPTKRDRRHPRRSRRADPTLRLAPAQGPCAPRGLAREARAPRCGRRSHDLGLHLGRRAGGGSRADRDVRCVHGPRAVPRSRAAAASQRPVAFFVGVLERYKAVDVLAEAWRLAAPQVPDATLHIVGRGALRDVVAQLVAELPGQTRWTEVLTTTDVARALDEATVLVLPSRSEGLGRVVVEAFCRGRGVVASRVGGIPDIVEDGVTGLLVPPGDATALADALVRALSEGALAERLGTSARVCG